MRTGLLAAGLLTILAVSPAVCQVPQRVKIDFDFGAGIKTYPAGEYRMVFPSGQPSIALTNSKTKILLNVVTRLARRTDAPKSVSLVFDRVGTKQFLSEIWVPGYDGYLVRSTKERHDHNIVGEK